jgi:hypothetical protein
VEAVAGEPVINQNGGIKYAEIAKIHGQPDCSKNILDGFDERTQKCCWLSKLNSMPTIPNYRSECCGPLGENIIRARMKNNGALYSTNYS